MLTTFVVSQIDKYHEVMTEALDEFEQIEAEETELHKKEEEEIKAAVAEIMARFEEQKKQVSARKTDAMAWVKSILTSDLANNERFSVLRVRKHSFS
jgi:hypothetical protein